MQIQFWSKSARDRGKRSKWLRAGKRLPPGSGSSVCSVIYDVGWRDDHQHPGGFLPDVPPHMRLLAHQMNAVARVKHKPVRTDLEFDAALKDIEDLFALVREQLHFRLRGDWKLEHERADLRLPEVTGNPVIIRYLRR